MDDNSDRNARTKNVRQPSRSRTVEVLLPNEWLGGRDSNPDTQIQSLQSYR